MISSAPEVQYVALRNISLILQKQPDILSKEWRIFCCRFNDPDYLKHEKLDIMVKLANDKNVDQLLMELKEYLPLRPPIYKDMLPRSMSILSAVPSAP